MSGLASYMVAKSGTNAFSATVLNEVRDWGVQVTSINPGIVATDLGMKPNAAAKKGELTPPHMLLLPADCGRAVLHVAECSPTCVVGDMTVDNLAHGYPAVRSAMAKFLGSML